MTSFICRTCGTQFAETAAPPPSCPICEDERQFLDPAGQAWTTPDALGRGHWNVFRPYEPGLVGIGTTPAFAIGQRALLVSHPSGNVLWDCVSLIDEATARFIRDLGGLGAIAISHPHYYSGMVDWSRAFGGVPIHLHAADREWVMRPDAAIRFWDGDRLGIADGLELIRLGGHFEGGTVLHWSGGAGGRGALLTGDVVQVVADKRRVSFMRSYPNLIPLGRRAVRRITTALDGVTYDRIYGAWWDAVVDRDAATAVERSADRYLHWISTDPEDGGGP